jgi:methyl-accepting chemotaxis protein
MADLPTELIDPVVRSAEVLESDVVGELEDQADALRGASEERCQQLSDLVSERLDEVQAHSEELAGSLDRTLGVVEAAVSSAITERLEKVSRSLNDVRSAVEKVKDVGQRIESLVDGVKPVLGLVTSIL